MTVKYSTENLLGIDYCTPEQVQAEDPFKCCVMERCLHAIAMHSTVTRIQALKEDFILGAVDEKTVSTSLWLCDNVSTP